MNKGPAWETVTMTLAGLSLVLVILNAGLVLRNQSVQFTLSERQQVINQGLQFARIRQVLAQYVANAAMAKNDRELSDLLTRHGIAPGAAQVPAPGANAAPAGK